MSRWLQVCMLIAWPGWTALLEAAERPNIVFIMADDLGWADVAFHGGNAPTPCLDRLASQSLELEQHYVAPVCSPTRTGLMTGRCWSRFGVTTPDNARALPWDTITLPRALQQAGYETCLSGKWHLGSLPEHGPNHFGFDHSFGSLAGGVSPWNHRYKQGPFTRTWHRNGVLIEQPGHVTDLIAQEAIDWLKQRSGKPFFLYVPFTAVHLPVKEPIEWVDRVPAAIEGQVARHYAASIMHLDDAVSRILAALDELKLRENTLVVFTSDNGGSTAENNDLKYPDDNCPTGRLPGNNRPWRGQKGELYEGGTRVPTLVNWPGRVQPGRVEYPVQIIDWMPTFTTLARWPVQRDLKWDGIDLTPLLIQQLPLPERPLYAVAPQWKSRSLRSGDWKLIENAGTKTANDRWPQSDQAVWLELYNLREDPTEAVNLAVREGVRVKQLQELMARVSQSDRDALATD